jgi:hypothetical protein
VTYIANISHTFQPESACCSALSERLQLPADTGLTCRIVLEAAGKIVEGFLR